ncbi:hypothetical protein KIH74_23035 [Kineosporia sp. J2-2]|uniref:DUF5348 domain-containing protein n=1 Tax=Kineosporia corallincola TaxID=2835133 RepID=A0ABS5TLF1_9ACTN|nr:hypothetical protein [Kineosporia corallincola]MBT0771835.1 hypothetical protein [Kineosporia corallincola]
MPAFHVASYGGRRLPEPGDRLKIIGKHYMGGPLYGLADDDEHFDAVLYSRCTNDPLLVLVMTADEYTRQHALLNPTVED